MRYTLLILLYLFIPIDSFAKGLNIKEVTSPGGITAWLVEDHNVPVVSIKFSFGGAGAATDPVDKQGRALLTSNTMDEGAGDMTAQDFQKQLQDYSITIRYSASRDFFNGELKTLTKYKDRAFSLLKTSLTSPRFDDESLQRMRTENQSRIRSALGNPKWIAARILNDKAYEGHAYAQNAGGTLTTLDNITRNDLVEFHKSLLGKNNLIVAAAGDISAEDLGKILDTIFGDLPDVNLPEPPKQIELQNQGQTILFDQEIPQTIIEIIQPGISKDDPSFQTAQVLNFVLGSSGFGSRLTKSIREERGLTYGIYSNLTNMKYFNGLDVSTSTANQNTGELLELAKAEWSRMKTERITEDELKDAKTYLIGSLPLALSSTDKIAGLLLSLQQDNRAINYLDKRETKILETTAQDVQTLAGELLDENAWLVILVGKPEGVKPDQIVTTLPNAE